MLVLVFGVLLVMMPMAIRGLYQLTDLVLLRQADHYLEQVLLTAYCGMDTDSLAVGQPRLDKNRTSAAIYERFTVYLPASLKGRLKMTDLASSEQRIKPDINHWMGSNQPGYVPIITVYADFKDHQGNPVSLHRTMVLLID